MIRFSEGTNGSIRDEVRARLFAAAEPDFKTFNDKIAVPGYPTLGVRTPQLRKIVKEVAKQEGQAYLSLIEEAALGNDDTLLFEEVVVWGITIGCAPLAFEERLTCLDAFVPHIKDWATCDMCTLPAKAIKNNREDMWNYLQKWLYSSREFEIRFGLVSLLAYFVTEEDLPAIFKICEDIDQEAYYVKMAIAWLLSLCFIRYPQQTESFFEANTLSAWTHNKAIQKARESFRVSPEDKERIKALKRK